jgi:hypothetical protein
MEIVVDAHAEAAHVAAAPFELMDAGIADDRPVEHRDDSSPVLGWVFRHLSPLLPAGIRKPQRAPSHPWELHQRGDARPVGRLLGADDQPGDGRMNVVRPESGDFDAGRSGIRGLNIVNRSRHIALHRNRMSAISLA